MCRGVAKHGSAPLSGIGGRLIEAAEVSPLLPGFLSVFNWLASFTNFIDGAVYTGRKIEN
jgi:hypothetical protein